ncbi:MAG: ABC transporter substrate-binding protein, partial [Hyphomicrobiaceae bacterium]
MARRSGPMVATIVAAMLALPGAASAEVGELRIAKQYGISYLPLMLMEADKLVEKHATAAGLPDLKASWTTFGGGSAMNDAILSGSLHLASGGVGPLLTIWSKTRGNVDVRCVTALSSMPIFLNTRNPAVKSLADFSEKDKIALPAVKVSIQAITLQMAAEKAFGAGNHGKLDVFTVAMSHPDGTQALLSGAGEVTAHFTSPPFQYQQLKQPGIRRLLNSYEVLGGPATFNVVFAARKLRDESPKAYAAFLSAFEEATKAINADKKGAAARYLEIAKDRKSSVEDIAAMLTDPDPEFTMTPEATMKYAECMHKVGGIKVKPASWKVVG